MPARVLLMILEWDGSWIQEFEERANLGSGRSRFFEKTPRIKQILYHLRLVPGHGQSSSTFCTNIPSFFDF
jgi:hypothetical protein